jgi:hypothetical protein
MLPVTKAQATEPVKYFAAQENQDLAIVTDVDDAYKTRTSVPFAPNSCKLLNFSATVSTKRGDCPKSPKISKMLSNGLGSVLPERAC